MLKDIPLILLLTFGVISLICSLVSLYIIYIMRRWNGYIQLIIMLTAAQTIYDISIIIIPIPSPHIFQAYVFLRCFSGLVATLFTNIISYVVVYIVLSMKLFHITENMRIISTAIILPSMGISILIASPTYSAYGSSIAADFYYWCRIGSILLNITNYINGK